MQTHILLPATKSVLEWKGCEDGADLHAFSVCPSENHEEMGFETQQKRVNRIGKLEDFLKCEERVQLAYTMSLCWALFSLSIKCIEVSN